MHKSHFHDTDALAKSINDKSFHYKNMSEHEEQLNNLKKWPIFHEIIEYSSKKINDLQIGNSSFTTSRFK